MPQYTLTLELTARGKDGHSPKATRRNLAIAAATLNNVVGWGGQPIQDGVDIHDELNGDITLKVMGTDAGICRMIHTWLNPPTPYGANVSVKDYGGLVCPATLTLHFIINAASECRFHGDNDGTSWVRLASGDYNPTCQDFYLQKVVSGTDEYYIRNKKTDFYVHGDDDGAGWIRLVGDVNKDCQVVVFEQNGDKWRIKNKHSGCYVHGDKEGTSWLRYEKSINDTCQLFVFYAAINPN
jgi:hypothetical protein